MSELHIATTLDQPDVARSILAGALCNIHQIDSNGDQAAHLAARLNRVECFKVLVEYDARMGRKNFCGLTPLGEAQMNGNQEIVDLIKVNYTSPAPEPYIWDAEVTRETAAWYDVWDEEKQKLQWARLGPDGSVELSDTPPPMDVQRVIEAREQYGERNVVRRIHPNSLLSMRQVEHDAQKEKKKEKLEQVLKNRARVVEERCATKLQAHFRRVRARLQAEQRRREEVAANRIQRRFRFYRSWKRNNSAVKMQSVIRMALVQKDYHSFLWERLWWYRASRRLACHAQRLWRGFLARSKYRQLYAVKSLPDPTDHRNFAFWERLQSEAHPPRKELGIYAEYTLGGTPRSWQERAQKRDGIFFRDVTFYANTITKRAAWTKPKGWLFKDHREWYVLRVQTFWRARRARRKIRLYSKAKLLLERAHSQDLETTSPDITCLCNYTLYTHAVLFDYDRARGLYSQLNDFMYQRGVDNAFVLYSAAIFGAVTHEEDWDVIKDYARRAKEADERMQKRGNGAVDARDPPKSSYTIATAAFYLQSICNEHDPAESHHNYALCQMLVLGDLAGARESFLQALVCSPRDRRIIANFNTLLQDPDYLGDPTANAHELYLRLTRSERSGQSAHHADENGSGYHWDLNFHPDPRWTDYDKLVCPLRDNLWTPSSSDIDQLRGILSRDFGGADHLAGLIPYVPHHLLLRDESLIRFAGHIVEPLIREILRPGFHPNRIPLEVLELINGEAAADPRLNPDVPGGLYLRAAAGSVGEFRRMINNAIQNAPPRGYVKMDSLLPDVVENNRDNPSHADCSMAYIGETSAGTCNERWREEDDPLRADGALAQWEFFRLVAAYPGITALSIMVGYVVGSNKRRSWMMEAFLAAIMAMASRCRFLVADGTGLNDVNGGRPHFLDRMFMPMKAIIAWLAMTWVNHAHSSLMSLVNLPKAIAGLVRYKWAEISKYLNLRRMSQLTVRNLLQYLGHLGWKKRMAGKSQEEISAEMRRISKLGNEAQWADKSKEEKRDEHKRRALKSCGGETDADYSKEQSRRSLMRFDGKTAEEKTAMEEKRFRDTSATKRAARNKKLDEETNSSGQLKTVYGWGCGHTDLLPINVKTPKEVRCQACQAEAAPRKIRAPGRFFYSKAQYDKKMSTRCTGVVDGKRCWRAAGSQKGTLCVKCFGGRDY